MLFKLFVLDLFSPLFVLTIVLYSNHFVVMMKISAPLIGSLGKSWCSYLLCDVFRSLPYLLGIVAVCNINLKPVLSLACALELL